MSLVPDYESSSESDSDTNKEKVDIAETAGEKLNRGDARGEYFKGPNGDSQEPKNGPAQNIPPVKLPSASSVMKRRVSSENSVLANEYKKEEENKTKVLEQHVKMVSHKKSVPLDGKVNGKKVCWMYRRGRCRLGKKCKMYHDSELRNNEMKQNPSSEKNTIQQPVVHTTNQRRRGYEGTVMDEGDDRDGPINKIHKKRFGLGDTIVPSKKVIQHLQRINNNGSRPGY